MESETVAKLLPSLSKMSEYVCQCNISFLLVSISHFKENKEKALAQRFRDDRKDNCSVELPMLLLSESTQKQRKQKELHEC